MRLPAVILTSRQSADEVIAACLVSSGAKVHPAPLGHPKDPGLYALTCPACVVQSRSMRRLVGSLETMVDLEEWRPAPAS